MNNSQLETDMLKPHQQHIDTDAIFSEIEGLRFPVNDEKLYTDSIIEKIIYASLTQPYSRVRTSGLSFAFEQL